MKKYVIYILIFWLAGVGAAGAYELGDVDIHGFIAQGYLQSSSNDYVAETSKGTFEFNEMGINFSSELTDSLRVGIQLFAYDFGDIGNDEVTLDWAYGDYRFHNMLGLRAGKFKIAKGFYGESRDVDAVRTSILLPRSIYALNMRDVFNAMKGFSVYGELPAGFSYLASVGIQDVKVDSELTRTLAQQVGLGYKGKVYDQIYMMAGGGALGDAMGKAAASATEVSSVEDLNAETSYNLGLKWDTPLEGFRLGVTYLKANATMELTMQTPNPSFDPTDPSSSPVAYSPVTVIYDTTSSTVVSAEYSWRNLVLMAEGNVYRVVADLNGIDAVRSMPGWYGGASYRFTDWFELGGYYSEFYEDADDRKGEAYKKVGLPDHMAWEKDTCVSLRFDLNEYWIFKTEGHYIDGTYQMKDNVYAANDPFRDIDREYWLFAGKFSFSF